MWHLLGIGEGLMHPMLMTASNLYVSFKPDNTKYPGQVGSTEKTLNF